MQKTISRNNVTDLISSFGNKVFSVSFVKKTNGENREMVCRRKVTQHAKGIIPIAVRKDEDARNNVLTVYDMGLASKHNVNPETANLDNPDMSKYYRRINLASVYRIKCGEEYKVIDG